MKVMGKDKRGVLRGKCMICEECEEYETTGNILSEYCGHSPVQHEAIRGNEKQDPELEEPPEKKCRRAEGMGTVVVDDVDSSPPLPSQSLDGASLVARERLDDLEADHPSQEDVPDDTASSLAFSPVVSVEARVYSEMEVGDVQHTAKTDIASDVHVDHELKAQQAWADELAKQEVGVAFAVKRKDGKLFARCNVCENGRAGEPMSQPVKPACRYTEA